MASTTQAAGTERFVDQYRAFASNGAAGAPAWLKRVREEALERFAALGFPTTKDEKWRFTSVKPITQREFTLAGETETLVPEQLEPYFVSVDGGVRLVFVNGRFAESLSTVPDLAAGVKIRNLGAALEEDGALVRKHLGRHTPVDDNAFAALNTAFAGDGAFIYVPADTVVEQPVQVLFFTTAGSEPTMSHPRNLVVVEQGASLRLVESYGGADGHAYLTNAVTEVSVGDNARADCYRIQREGNEGYHVATTNSRQGRDSWYSLTPVVFGSALARHDMWMALNGEGGEGILNGLYIAGGHQHVDHNTVIEHAVPHCESHEYFNGVLDDESHAVFNGRIIVRPGAQKTDSKQTNNNLLMSENARADSQPQLEIYADDVRCTHGATLGPLDENALFYLQSRGIGTEAARALLTYGFGVEILNRVAVPEVREAIDALVKERLHRDTGGTAP